MASFILSMLLFRADCFSVATAELADHGVTNRRVRERIATELVGHYKKGRSPEVVERIARTQAERVSRDYDWVNWAAWNARNAYEQMGINQCSAP